MYLFVQVYVHLFHWLNCYAHLKRSFQHHVNSEVTWILLLIQVITALGKIWHIEHFSCAKCHETLGTKNFYERDGMAYCERDYHTLFAPKCSYCNGPIVDVSGFKAQLYWKLHSLCYFTDPYIIVRSGAILFSIWNENICQPIDSLKFNWSYDI